LVKKYPKPRRSAWASFLLQILLPAPSSQDKFSLEYTPDRMIDVSVPEGTTMRTGIAGDVDQLGTSGGGTQFELMDEIPKA